MSTVLARGPATPWQSSTAITEQSKYYLAQGCFALLAVVALELCGFQQTFNASLGSLAENGCVIYILGHILVVGVALYLFGFFWRDENKLINLSVY